MQLKVQIIRSQRKTLSIQIDSHGQVIARAPIYMPEADIRKFIQEKEDWIEKHLQKRQIEKEALQEEGKFTQEEIQKLANLATAVIPQKVAYYARLMNVTYGRITIRNQKTRWGSCTREGNLNFNCLLMMTPPEVLDYVVVHELCHRLEMNHSARFWVQVEKVMPDYKKHRKWLKEHGGKLMLRMHGE